MTGAAAAAFILLLVLTGTGLAQTAVDPTSIRPAPSALPDPPVTRPGLALTLGAHGFAVEAGEPTARRTPGSLFSDGATFGLGWIEEYWRVEYLRQVVRHSLPQGTQFRDMEVRRLAFETDQLWGHLGWRPGRRLYLGAALAIQQRRILYSTGDEDDSELRTSEVGLAAGALAEFGIAPPFLVQLRWVEDLNHDKVTVSGPVAMLLYLIPF